MLEGQWAKSEETNDVALVAPLLADNFIYTGTDGTVSDRAAFLALLRATQWSGVKNEDVKATAFGDTVAVPG
ncbi:MAG: nuclear transport factor 2 family protein [Proteobacteria bacterium]|nr:nuclear transport factor 2 family protein [Pseudomonadota bacterium]